MYIKFVIYLNYLLKALRNLSLGIFITGIFYGRKQRISYKANIFFNNLKFLIYHVTVFYVILTDF